MAEERRQARRARAPALRVTYESAAGEQVEADALDVSTGGIFVGSATPAPSGKRLSLEFHLASETTRWSALGRVVWTRATSTADGPAGMGVKLIDADEGLIALIERLVNSREQTIPGAGAAKMPARERTMLGIGLKEQAPASAAPIIAVAPKREKTIVGVGMAVAAPPAPIEPTAPAEPPAPVEPLLPVPSRPPAPQEAPPEAPRLVEAPEPPSAHEPPSATSTLDESVALDLVARKPREQAPISDDSLAEAGVPRRRRWRWLVLLILLALAGGGVYLARHRIPWERIRSFVASKLPR
jgi:uncharacterized protein (TIGR02266 family)